jgi:hypothetical protein
VRDLKSGKFIPDKNFRQNGSLTFDGYRRIHVGEYYKADKEGRIKEHIYVYEQHYKCCILPWGIVHHINGIRIDNRIENLEAMTRVRHYRIHPHPRRKYS